MAFFKRGRTPEPDSPRGDPKADRSGNGWDYTSGPPDSNRPAGETMPRRAATLANQNGPAMRSVFAYLLDEDSLPIETQKPKKR
jgi:hypothetical protein